MTPQAIFDTVARAVIKQGKASTQDGRCVYRAEDGSKCAVGHVLPDEVYLPAMDDLVLSLDAILADDDRFPLPQWMYDHQELLELLQEAHDAAAGSDHFLTEFRLYMDDLADDLDLDPSVLTEPVESLVERPVEPVEAVKELELA